MLKRLVILGFLTLLACSRNDKNAREALDEAGIPYTVQAFLSAAETSDLENVENFLASGMSPTVNAGAPLRTAIDSSDVLLLDLFVSHGIQLDSTYWDGFNVLWAAVENGNEASIAVLLNGGANPDVRNHAGDTPLIYAARNGNVELIRQLLSHGADPLKRNARRETALWTAFTKEDEKAFSIFLDKGRTISDELTGNPLFVIDASRAGRTELLKELFDMGADPGAARTDGYSALMAATYAQQLPAMELLLASGANPNHVNNSGFQAETALMIAATNNNLEAVEMLLRAGADPMQRDRFGRRAVDLAQDTRVREILNPDIPLPDRAM